MPNRQQRRSDSPDLGKWLHVEDANGNPYDIHLRDISGKDEWDYLQMMAATGMPNPPGLCDIFLEGKVTLTNIAGLIWSQRRKYERKLTIPDVLKTVNMETLETMELHDPEEEGIEALPPDDPRRKLAEMEAQRVAVEQAGDGVQGFDGGSDQSSLGSEPSTA